MSIPRLSIVIPSRTGLEMPLLRQLLTEQLPGQTFQDFEVHVVVGDTRQGRAINEGVRRSAGELVATMDDDIELGGDDVLERLVSLLYGDPTIGIVGAACPVPEDSTPFQRAAMRQIPRRYFPVVDRPTDSDMVQHGCLLRRRDLFWRVGGEDEDLVRGLDPIIRSRVRDLGLRVVVAPGTWFYHRPPANASALLRMYYRNGRGSAFATRHFPDRVYELGSGFEEDDFPTRRPFGYRVGRRVCTTGKALASGEWVRLAVDLAYTAGFAAEYLGGSEPPTRPERHVRLDRRVGERITIWRSHDGPGDPATAMTASGGMRPRGSER